jgi:hypothetical protein
MVPCNYVVLSTFLTNLFSFTPNDFKFLEADVLLRFHSLPHTLLTNTVLQSRLHHTRTNSRHLFLYSLLSLNYVFCYISSQFFPWNGPGPSGIRNNFFKEKEEEVVLFALEDQTIFWRNVRIEGIIKTEKLEVSSQ